MSICVRVYMCVHVYVCMCMYVWMHAVLSVCVHVCV